MVGVIVAAAGVVVSAVASVFSWLQGEESQETQANAEDMTVYAERTIFIQKSHGLMFMLDAERNLRRIRETLRRYNLTEKNIKELWNPRISNALFQTIRALESVNPILITDKMPTYNSIIDPADAQTYWLASDDGYIASQGRFLLPNLNNARHIQKKSTTSVNPIIPGAVGAAIGYVARGPVGAAVGAAVGAGGGMLLKKKNDEIESRMTVKDFLMIGSSGLSDYDRHMSIHATTEKEWKQITGESWGQCNTVPRTGGGVSYQCANTRAQSLRMWYNNYYLNIVGKEPITYGLEMLFGNSKYKDDQLRTYWTWNDQDHFRTVATLNGVYND